MFTINENANGLYVIADDQTWDDKTLEAIEKKGIYLDGCVGVMKIPNNKNLVAIGIEDDGCLSFRKNKFGSYETQFHHDWIQGLINSLEKAK